MDTNQIRIQILNLQDAYCRQCEHQNSEFINCRNDCEIGANIYTLGKQLNTVCTKYSKRTKEEWDILCVKAIEMKKAGIIFREIAEAIGCSQTALRENLKKRSRRQ